MNSDNIFSMISTLCETKQDIPCLRIGQIIHGFHEYLEMGKKIDPYYITDEKYAEFLKEYCDGFLGRKHWRYDK